MVSREDLVGEWLFNGKATDSSGNGNDGSVSGASLTTGINGEYNQAYYFNGTSDYISTTMNIGSYSSWSYSVWIKPSTTNDSQQTLSNDAGGYDNSIQIGIAPETSSVSTTHRFAVVHQDSAGSTRYVVEDNQDISTTSWTFFVYTYDGSTQRLYRDGTLVDSTSKSGLTNNANSLILGKNPANIRYYGGKITKTRIYNKALSATEIKQLYNEVNNAQSLLEDCKLLFDFKGDALDSSGNGNDGTVTGATLTTDHLGFSNHAYDFNGSGDQVDTNLDDDSPYWAWSVWINPDSLTTNQDIIDDGRSTATSGGRKLRISSSGKILGYYGYSGSGNAYVSGTPNSVGSWTHVVLNYDGTLTLWIDGVLAYTSANNPPYTTTNYNVLLGNGQYYYNGQLSYPMLWSRALSAGEIKALYDLTKKKYIYPYMRTDTE